MYDNKNLNLPTLEWIGLKISDIENFLPEKSEEYSFKLSEADKRIAKSLISKFETLKEYELVKEVKFEQLFLNKLNANLYIEQN